MCTKWLIILRHYIFLPSILINFMFCLNLYFSWEFFHSSFLKYYLSYWLQKVFTDRSSVDCACESQTLSINSQTCVQICVSSHILLTWRPSSKPSPVTAVGGEPQHPKESEPWQGCLTCCSHWHSFKGDWLYNEIKVKHKILTNYGACALPLEVNPGLRRG